MALACTVKVYPIAFGLLLAAAYPRAFAWRFGAALAIGLALPFCLQDPGYVWRQYNGWIQLVGSDTGRQDWASLDLWYRDVRFLFKVWGEPISGETYRMLQVGSAALLAAGCLAGRWSGWTRTELTTFALGSSCCWMLVLGPCTESCTYLLLAPALVWALVDSFSVPLTASRVLLMLSYGLFLSVSVGSIFPWGKSWQMFGVHPAAGLIFVTALAAQFLGRVTASLPHFPAERLVSEGKPI
jgi:hypothetical protein